MATSIPFGQVFPFSSFPWVFGSHTRERGNPIHHFFENPSHPIFTLNCSKLHTYSFSHLIPHDFTQKIIPPTVTLPNIQDTFLPGFGRKEKMVNEWLGFHVSPLSLHASSPSLSFSLSFFLFPFISVDWNGEGSCWHVLYLITHQCGKITLSVTGEVLTWSSL